MRSRTAISLAALALVCGLYGPPDASGQRDTDLLPRFGETAREFEARKQGVPPPAREDPASQSFLADTHGQFWVSASVDGTPLQMMVDTGATVVVLSDRDARQLGIKLAPGDFTRKSATANGVVQVAPVLLREITVGEIAVANVQAVVVPENRLAMSLLGMSFLGRLSHFEIKGGRLLLKR